MSKMSKSDKKLLCWLVGTLFVLILLGVIFGVSSVRESFSSAAAEDEDYHLEEEDYDVEEEDNDVEENPVEASAVEILSCPDKYAQLSRKKLRIRIHDIDKKLSRLVGQLGYAKNKGQLDMALKLKAIYGELQKKRELLVICKNNKTPGFNKAAKAKIAKAAKAANISGGIPAGVDPEKGYHESVGEFLNRCKEHNNRRCHNEISDTQADIENKYAQIRKKLMVKEIMTYAREHHLSLREPDARNILEKNGYNMENAMTDWIDLLAEQQDNLASIA